VLSRIFGKKAGEDENESGDEKRRIVDVGWVLKNDAAGVIWDTPKPVSWGFPAPTSSKSAQACPAVIQFDRLHYVINCPVDLHFRINQTPKGELQLTNVDGPMSTVRQSGLQKLVLMSPQNEWRHPMRPILQMATPFVFLSDDPVYVNQFPPFLHYPRNPLPGVQVCGRFPIDVWPRVHMWAMEWHDMKKDLIFKRGEPLFYVRFETTDPSTPVRLFEAEKTSELETYMEQISDVTDYVNQSFKLFKTARERRPEKLLVRKKR
jgi:hypothetical protein